MSTEHRTPGVCEQLLDYEYGELAGEARAAFELHLQTCAKCQAELAQLARVRGAVKAALPSVEPPANATGALHAQLLQAAAQRAGGGRVIPLTRRVQRVMLSPAFLAAAMFVLIGGAAGTMYLRGRWVMPERAAEAPLTAAAPVRATPAEKKGLPEAESAVADKVAQLNEGGERLLGALSGKDSAPPSVRRAPAMHAAGKSSAGAREEKREAAPAPEKHAMAQSVTVMKARKLDNAALDDRLMDGATVAGGDQRAVAVPRGEGGNGEAAPVPEPAASASAPPPSPSDNAKAPAAARSQTHPPLESELAGPKASSPGDSVRGAMRTPEPSPTPARESYGQNNQTLEQKAVGLAEKGRCDDALPLFEQLLREMKVSLSVQERVQYIDCLRRTQRLRQATEALELLRRDKHVQNRLIQDEAELLGREALKAAPARVPAPKPTTKSRQRATPAAAPAGAKPGR